MKSFNWDLNNLDKNSNIYKILNAKNKNHLDQNDQFLNVPKTFNEFKRRYYQEIKDMMLTSSDGYMYINSFINSANYDLLSTIIFPHENIKLDDLKKIILDYYNYLPDQTYTKLIKNIINPDNNIFKISDYDEKNEVCKYYRGRIIRENDNIFGSYYIKHNMEDFPLLCHELGHMSINLLFNKNKNPYFNSYLSEFESITNELLMDSYIGSITDLRTENNLINNRIGKTISNIYILKTLKIMYHKLGRKITIKYINKKMKNSNIQFEDDLDMLIESSFYREAKQLLSSLLSIYIYMYGKNDLKNALKIYKGLILSKENNINNILFSYGIIYDDLAKSFNEAYNQVKKLYMVK